MKILTTSLFQFTTLSLDQGLSVLVQVQLGDDDLGWVDVGWDGSTVRLFLGQLVNLDSELQSVDRGNLTFLTLLGTTNNQDFVFLSDWQSLDVVLFSQFFGQRSGQQHTTFRGWGSEVSLSGLSSVRGNVCEEKRETYLYDGISSYNRYKRNVSKKIEHFLKEMG